MSSPGIGSWAFFHAHQLAMIAMKTASAISHGVLLPSFGGSSSSSGCVQVRSGALWRGGAIFGTGGGGAAGAGTAAVTLGGAGGEATGAGTPGGIIEAGTSMARIIGTVSRRSWSAHCRRTKSAMPASMVWRRSARSWCDWGKSVSRNFASSSSEATSVPAAASRASRIASGVG